jgi:8-oxo-dGTP pyrophosphatase MutT (NUDIX family)
LRARLETQLAAPASRYRPLVVDDLCVGWLDDARATRLLAHPDVFDVAARQVGLVSTLTDRPSRTAAIDRVSRILSAEGLLSAWRDERYAVGAAWGAPALFEIERAAARYFGIHTFAAHVNGLCRIGSDIRMWIARRSAQKAIDPGLLDNLVGGGITAGRSVQATVVKEAGEEAGIDASLAAKAVAAGTVHICRARPDGLQRETIFVHDLWLPGDFVPIPVDREVSEFRLESLAAAAILATHEHGPDMVTADASLVIVDCLLRHGMLAMDAPDHTRLGALRYPAMTPSRVAS